MVANWTITIDKLRADLHVKGFRLPEQPAIDGRWHRCPDGAYLIFAQVPHIALARNAAHVTIWRADDRLLSVGQQQRIDVALASLPFAELHVEAASTARDLRPSYPPSTPHSDLSTDAWLRAILSAGPVASVEVRQQAAASGLAWSAARRAARRLGVVARRSGFGPRGAWRWELVDVLTLQLQQHRP
jgi:hypothetical protein